MTLKQVAELVRAVKQARQGQKAQAEWEAEYQHRRELAKQGQCVHEAYDPWRYGSGPILDWRSLCVICEQVIKADHEPKDYTDWVYVVDDELVKAA